MVHQHIVQTERCKTFADISYETESSQNKPYSPYLNPQDIFL